MAQNFTPILMGALAVPSTFNEPLGELDAAIGKHNLSATVDPTANDDAGDGYGVGSRWVNVSTDAAFMCVDATEGAAVWASLTGGGGGGGAIEVIAQTILSSAAATVTFDSISGDYEALLVHWLARVGASGEKLYARFNDDAGSNYEYYCRYGYTLGTVDESTSATRLTFAELTSGSVAHPASYASPGELWIPGYAGTTFYKSALSHFGDYYDTSHPNYPSGGGGRWKSTSAITKIVLGLVSGNNLDTGSRFLLLGIKGE